MAWVRVQRLCKLRHLWTVPLCRFVVPVKRFTQLRFGYYRTQKQLTSKALFTTKRKTSPITNKLSILRQTHHRARASPPKAVKYVVLGSIISTWIVQTSDFNVPNLDDVRKKNPNKTVQELLEENERISKNWGDSNEREILPFTAQILQNICGRNGLKNKIVVDVGVGTGTFTFPIADAVGDNGLYIGLDISEAFLFWLNDAVENKGNRKNIKLGLTDSDKLRLPDKLKKKVDVFFMCATYGFLDTPNVTMKEMCRFLRPGGSLVIIDYKTRETEVRNNASKHGFILDHEIMKDYWKDHFVHVYKIPNFG